MNIIEKIWKEYQLGKAKNIDPALLIALQEYGTKEIVGKDNNPEVMKYFHEAGFFEVDNDETSWCLRGDTQILTDKGFIRLDEAVYKGGTAIKVAQLNTDDNSVLFTSEFIWLIKEYNGELYHIDKPSVNLFCDPDHEFYGKWSSSKVDRKRKIKDMSSLGVGIPTIRSSSKGYDISDRDLKLLAAFLSDGHARFNRMNIGVSKEHKKEILNTLNPVWIKDDNKVYGNRKLRTMYTFKFTNSLRSCLSDYKVLSWNFIKNLSERQCRLFIETYSKFDGSTSGSGINLFTACDKLADNLIYIASMGGFKATLSRVKQVSKNTKIEYLNTIYISKNNKNKYVLPKDITKEHFDGFLYCATVPTGVIIIKDLNGNILPVGNCSAFVNWCQIKAGRAGTGSLAARSWLHWGEKVMEPEIGDIAIFWRTTPESWQGHVAFFIKRNGTHVWVLGGNQSNMVNIIPYDGTKLLGYRRAKD